MLIQQRKELLIFGGIIGRIFNESKNRPLYLVDEYNGKKEMNEK